ncbi:ABC transporter ATP-binding protein [Salinisphaera hydrothermalis]|uniref:ABC transporter ATP-binding protein YurJ n=1 Tax=Salinisphaera hydrothermalis (strain C41B8) TaxID=1304275 RepID=A0A084IIT0_SALHC|nr:ABC transporter ATP-binding protein [Salinisphaera hydrothermalis]KEZ76614.1 ABC transporter ATP-binding protein YurJ [Salinisphaera hydrothermalis C41B8]
MAVVELSKVGKQYPGSDDLAVKDFNLVTEDGEFVVLVGPSGCGKTTTMRMIAGLEEHTQGAIKIGGRDVTGVAPKDRDIAMVFQSYALYPHMTVRDNMAFSLKLKKYDKADIKKRVDEAAEVLGITALLERKPRALSGGQRQRVALGRAIVRQPQVFLMDEPLSNLDAKLRVDMRAEIVKLHRKLGVTTFYVTHDQTEAMTMGQRIAVMKDGIVQQIDSPNNLYQRPSNVFVAGFIGTPSMNFLDADIDGERATGTSFELALDEAHRQAAGDRSRIRIGIRPEHLHLASADDSRCRLSGAVEVVEPLGSLTMIQVKVGETTLTAQIEPHQQVAMGDDVTLTCAPDKLYLFDPESEAALIGIDSGVADSPKH